MNKKTYNMKGFVREKTSCGHSPLVRWERILSPSGAYSQSVGNVLHTLRYAIILMMMVTGVNVWGQEDYSGVYYIGSVGYNASTPESNFYLCPTEGWCYYQATDDFTSEDSGKPFLTTYKCQDGVYDVRKAVWIIEKAPAPNDSYYYIKQALTGRYLTSNGTINTTNNADRMRVHLEDVATENLDDKELFTIEFKDSKYFISPKGVVGSATDRKWLVVNGGNENDLKGIQGTGNKTGGPSGYTYTTGIIGIYTQADNNAPFYLEEALSISRPIITNNYTAENTFTISAAEGATIYYTTDGSTPTTSTTATATSGTGTTSVNITQTESMTVIKAIAKAEGDAFPSVVTIYKLPKCERPVIKLSSGYVTITCATQEAAIHYTTDDTPATSTSTTYTGPFAKESATTFRAIATKAGYVNSNEAVLLPPTEVSSSSQITDMNGNYILASNFSSSGSVGTAENPFKGTIDGDMTPLTISYPLVAYAEDATIKNVILKNITISGGANVGAICNEATGSSRIYNCGVLATPQYDNEGNITGFSGSSVSGTSNVGGLVGFLRDESRVINCYSYANISGVTNAGGLVGNNNEATTLSNLKTMVMNCMFYGNITGATNMKPVYGGQKISNAGATGVNNYNYYRNGADVTFDDNYVKFEDYYCTLPADEEYLTRFEYYRSVLNSNRKLCTWWVNGTDGTAPTDEDVSDVGIAKWVLDPSIAPYPILKPWGKYPSVINQDPEYVWNPKTRQQISRSNAEPYQGKKLGTISVTVNAGAKHTGSVTLPSVVVMDMDTLNHDYCYAKIQLPYYNEVFGDPTADAATHWDDRYGGNYKEYVVTGWKITNITGGTPGSFKGYAFNSSGGVSATAIAPDVTSTTAWEDGFNFADRYCTNKDLYSKSGRVFAQGGYYYVPEGVTAITIEAYWGKAVYLHNKEHSLERVDVASGGSGDGAEFGSHFSPAGKLPNKFQEIDVQTSLQDAIAQLAQNSSLTVYDQAIVLVGNVQVKNRSASVGNNDKNKRRPFTIMSIDEDMDNEPDYCLEFQFRNTTDRPGIHPIRFDFLPVPELGLAIRTDQKAYAIGVFIPTGHFEITETSFMHTTQFEYDGNVNRVESPIILNGGHFEQIVVRYGPKDKVSYFLLGGHFRIKRFTPGYHASNVTGGNIRHCVVNAIGGDFPELYLSGVYRPELAVNADNPHCYINGGRFGTMAGAGYEQVDGNVTFKIDHAIIDKFYGGGMNGAKPVTGNIDVTINNSIVYDIFCGGPMVGTMTKPTGESRKTVTTTADNTIFGKFFGGGNGGTSYYREQKYDNDVAWPNDWKAGTYKFTEFNPLNTVSGKSSQYETNKGYHDMFEFEVFNSSNGLNSNCVARTFIQWAQFGTTITGNVTNTLTNCTVEGNFYGGGNLGQVDGTVTSTLINTHVKGSVFGAGYSAEIPRFRMHDVNKVYVPTRNKAGLIEEQGHLDYVQDDGKDRYYRWTNDTNSGTAKAATPTYWSAADGEYKCYTPISLEGLGEVEGATTLIIDGTSQIDGNVFGGGDASAVKGNVTVTLKGSIQVEGDVFGGGNKGEVSGKTTVKIEE